MTIKKCRSFFFGLLITVLPAVSPGCYAQLPSSNADPISHTIWDELLQKHVTSDGIVNYKGFIRDSVRLNAYLDLLSKHPPNPDTWSEQEQIAYWINVYNAFIVRLIIRNYPLNSIRDLHPTLKIPGIHTVWHRKFFEIGGEPMSLDHVEHGILREVWEEPRIHFGINCASYSCPKLHYRAFTGDNLDEKLNLLAREFINDTTRNRITKGEVEISQIFRWFRKDFTRNSDVIDYLNKYSETTISPDAKVRYMTYDWSLNE